MIIVLLNMTLNYVNPKNFTTTRLQSIVRPHTNIHIVSKFSIIHYFNIYSYNSGNGDISITICEKHKLEFGCFVGCQEIVFVICNPNLRLTVVRIQFVSVSSPNLTFSPNPLPFTSQLPSHALTLTHSSCEAYPFNSEVAW